jgi:2-phosphoglycerate kinase
MADVSMTPDELDRAGFAYVKGLMVPWLMATGLGPEKAFDLARRTDDAVGRAAGGTLSLDRFRALARDVLGAAHGDRTVERFCLWHDFVVNGRALIVLIGGGTGVGKSTVAEQLAHQLGITHVSSTDFIRQVLRAVVPDAIAPELGRSSFELEHGEFERQAAEVLVGVRATIERAARERTALIVEGIHLDPELLDVGSLGNVTVVHVVLAVADEDAHAHRFELRAAASARPAERYEESLDSIRRLQDQLVARARRAGIPVLENRSADVTAEAVLELVFARLGEALPRRPLRAA